MHQLAKSMFISLAQDKLSVATAEITELLKDYNNSDKKADILIALGTCGPDSNAKDLDTDQKEIISLQIKMYDNDSIHPFSHHLASNNPLLVALSLNKVECAEVILDTLVGLYNLSSTTTAEKTQIKDIINYTNGYNWTIVTMLGALTNIDPNALLSFTKKLIANKSKFDINFTKTISIDGKATLPLFYCFTLFYHNKYNEANELLFDAVFNDQFNILNTTEDRNKAISQIISFLYSESGSDMWYSNMFNKTIEFLCETKNFSLVNFRNLFFNMFYSCVGELINLINRDDLLACPNMQNIKYLINMCHEVKLWENMQPTTYKQIQEEMFNRLSNILNFEREDVKDRIAIFKKLLSETKLKLLFNEEYQEKVDKLLTDVTSILLETLQLGPRLSF